MSLENTVAFETLKNPADEIEKVIAERLEVLRKRLHELDLQKPTVSAFYEELGNVKREIRDLQGLDSYFQVDGDVYKMTKQTQKIVFWDEVDYKRTPRDGEDGRGRLSKKEAKEQGFEVK